MTHEPPHDPTPGICEECGLPSTICNALAFFRLAADSFEHKDDDAAGRNIKVAREYFEEFRRDRASTRATE